MYTLSIVVPVYNVEKYINKCLDSLLPADKYNGDYEIIIVNDGSADNSPALAQKYVDDHPDFIRMISTENFGLGHARNVGIENSSGEFLYFIDSDDYLIPGSVEKLLELVGNGADITIFDAVSVKENGEELKYIKGSAKSDDISLSVYPGLLLEIPNVWNKIYRRSLFAEHDIKFPDHAWFEDIRTVLKLYAIAGRIEYTPLPLYRYVQRSNSITRAKKTERNIEMIDAMDDIAAFFKSVGRYDELKNELEYLTFHSQFLTSPVRANLSQWNAPVQGKLIDDYLSKYPDFQNNPYVKNISKAHKLLTKLYLKKRYMAVHILMKMNAIVKGTNI